MSTLNFYPLQPTIPPVPGGFTGWAKINGADGVIIAQSTSAPLDTCVRTGVASYDYTLKDGVDNQTLHVQAEGSSASGVASIGAGQASSATFRNESGTLVDVTHSVFFYGA